MKKHGIDPAPCQEIFARTGQASEAIRHGQYLLVQKYLQLQEEEWNRLITEAEEHKARKEWDEALVLIRKVLAAKPGFERANQLLPQVLVKKAVDHREAGERGAAAVAFEEALLQLPVGDRPKAAVPISELLIQAANEDVEQVVLRSHPHPAAGLVRPVALNETFMGEETESSTAAKVKYIKVKLKEGAEAYVLRSCVRAGAGSGEYAISVGVTPFKDVKRQIDTAKGFAPSLTASADEVFGRLSAREGKTKYEAGNYQAALAHFEEATKFAPTDPRLSLKFKCWLKANTGALVAVLGVVAFALGIAIMQAFARPKKVKFQGDFKHYGQDRSARERDLDLPEE